MVSYYTYRGEGRAMGSVVVVAAEDEEIARRFAEAWAEEHGIAPGSLRMARVVRTTQPVVVFGWDGDLS